MCVSEIEETAYVISCVLGKRGKEFLGSGSLRVKSTRQSTTLDGDRFIKRPVEGEENGGLSTFTFALKVKPPVF